VQPASAKVRSAIFEEVDFLHAEARILIFAFTLLSPVATKR